MVKLPQGFVTHNRPLKTSEIRSNFVDLRPSMEGADE